MKNYIYHNPRWGKSRKSVEILNKENIQYTTIEYLKEPLDKDTLNKVFQKLNMSPKDVLRKNETEYKENNINAIIDDDDKLIEAIIKFPKILERPIIIIDQKAVIGRPPENIYDIIWFTMAIISLTLMTPLPSTSPEHNWPSVGFDCDIMILTTEITSLTLT